MASPEQVRAYLAYWFQLGKPVLCDGQRPPQNHREASSWLPTPIFSHGQYSQSFEACWQQIMVTEGCDCHLAGTTQTIADLLSPQWDIEPCARCALPVPLPIGHIAHQPCPCNDLPQWPNTEVPSPRAAINSDRHLTDLRDRLTQVNLDPSKDPTADRDRLQTLFQRSAGLHPTPAPDIKKHPVLDKEPGAP